MYEDEVLDTAAEVVYEDETLVCKECGQEFVFSAGEQRFFAEKGFFPTMHRGDPKLNEGSQ